ERFVAPELEATLLAGEDPGEQTHERAGVSAIDCCGLTRESGQTPALHDKLVFRDVVHFDAERAHGVDRRLRVAGAAEAADACLAFAERADQHRAVRDRLIARDGDVADQRAGGLDLHSSMTGDTTTWYPCVSSTPAARAASPSP